MILFDSDLNDVKFIAHSIKSRALIEHDTNMALFADKILYLAERYQEHNDVYGIHDKYERKAYSFIMRFAERLRDKDIYHECEFSPFDFKNEFIELLDDYPALQQKFIERLRGDN